jgi:hypothetical protein
MHQCRAGTWMEKKGDRLKQAWLGDAQCIHELTMEGHKGRP